MKFVRFSVLLLMAINLLNLNWLQAEDKEASPFVWVDKAAEAYRAGKVKEAVQFADRAVAAEPKNPRLHFFKGQLYNALREYDKSIAAYTKALALKPEPEHKSISQQESGTARFSCPGTGASGNCVRQAARACAPQKSCASHWLFCS